ncbi:MAG: DUF721 domain-containing protein [Bacteroidales bacterium]|nr:DUF721 domain-containing protein [Bacteroidales bacterium]
MQKSNTKRIGEVLREYVESLRMSKKLKEVDIVSHWEEFMGKSVARRTQKIYINNKTLYIHLTSSVLRNELLMMRQMIIDRINDRAGENIINKIVFR